MNLKLVSLITLLGIAATASAQEAPSAPTLKVGDPAPKLTVSKWVKGGPIDKFEKGRIYVIECWATWCGPCRAAIPHVTALQKKYKDQGVVVIGMNVWERDPAAVDPFLKEMGDKMEYAVALDDVSEGRPGKTAAAWLQAAGRNGIPCSFLVDKQGKIAWIGHPMSMDGPLDKLANDKFDAAEQAKLDEKVKTLQENLSKALRANDNEAAIKTLDELTVINPAMSGFYDATKLSLLVRKADYDAVNKLAARLAESDDAMTLGRTAFTLLNAPDTALQKLDAALALKIAEKAVKASDGNWQFQSLLAKAHAANKQFDKAVEIQTRVVEAAPERAKPQEKKSLEEYQSKARK